MKNILWFALGILLTALSCTNQEKKPFLPNASGKQGEIVVVMSKAHWDGKLGDFFRENFQEPLAYLPQPEPKYDLLHISPSDLKNMYKIHRNIFLIKLGDDFKEAKVVFQNNLWAKPQVVANMVAPGADSLLAYLQENVDRLLESMAEIERKRLMDLYAENVSLGVSKLLQKNHHATLTVPMGYNLDVDSSDFVWISNETAFMTQGILLYHYPYTDPNTFTVDYLVKKRNEFMRKYVPGPVEGSHMTTEEDFPPRLTEMTIRGKYAAELRGLWKTKGAFMGGPFISVSMVDEKRNRVVTAEGFLYSPRYDKRTRYHELEAIVYSLEIVE